MSPSLRLIRFNAHVRPTSSFRVPHYQSDILSLSRCHMPGALSSLVLPQTYLERELLSHGFSAEVIAKLRLGDRGDTPQELPKEGKEKPEDEQGRGREGGKDEEVGQEQDEMEEVKGIGQEGGGDTEQEQADADKTGPKVKVEVKADSQDGDGKPR